MATQSPPSMITPRLTVLTTGLFMALRMVLLSFLLCLSLSFKILTLVLFQDNVHFQHSLVLINDLTQANVDFDIHIYTDSDHTISTGPNTQRDLYRRLTDYLKVKQSIPRP